MLVEVSGEKLTDGLRIESCQRGPEPPRGASSPLEVVIE
jgi:hypothetical protein